MKKIILILILLLMGCEMIELTEITGKTTQTKTVMKEENFEYEVVFCPRENCSNKLANFILSAKESVHCAFFDLDSEEIIEALEIADAEVQVLIDGDNYEIVEEYKWAKGEKRSRFSHNKFCIVDGKKISTGSTNPTDNGFEKNNNNLIFIESKYLAQNYEKEFTELWNGIWGKGNTTKNPTIYLGETKIESYFCPEDRCSEKIIDVMKTAEESIKFMTFSYTHEAIANAMLMKNLEGKKVKGIFEKRGTGSQYSRYKILEYQGTEVRKDNNSAVMHHKVFIIDDKIVITGSMNPSKNADKYNDENVIIIYNSEVAAEYIKEFEFLWENYTEKE